jgi:hypothetical protein
MTSVIGNMQKMSEEFKGSIGSSQRFVRDPKVKPERIEAKTDVHHVIEFQEARSDKLSGIIPAFSGRFLNEYQKQEY